MNELNLFGWIQDPDAVARTLEEMTAAGRDPIFTSAAGPTLLDGDDDNKSVFFWEAEQKVLGRILGPWNQNPVGSCVGFGNTLAVQDLMILEIASGEPEEFPGELASEVTYIGSRVEVNNGRCPIRPTLRDPNGDGSVGAWASKFLLGWGVVARGRYQDVDLTQYDPAWTRANQFSGLPTHLEEAARLHPVGESALVRSAREIWSAIGFLKPVAFCSQLGFTMNANSSGYCTPEGEWGHCQRFRGRFVHPKRGRSFVACNQWMQNGRVLHPMNGPVTIETVDRGPVKLPPGHYAVAEDVAEHIARENDSFAYAGLGGWVKKRFSWRP